MQDRIRRPAGRLVSRSVLMNRLLIVGRRPALVCDRGRRTTTLYGLRVEPRYADAQGR